MDNDRHDRCPNCGKYVGKDAGFYDWLPPFDDGADLGCFCNLVCSDQLRVKHKQKGPHDD